jgi:hypothetical protein
MQASQDQGADEAPVDHAEQPDASFPTLLLASLAAVLAAVVGLVAIVLVPTTWMLIAGELTVVLGLAGLIVLIAALLADEGGRSTARTSPQPASVDGRYEADAIRREDTRLAPHRPRPNLDAMWHGARAGQDLMVTRRVAPAGDVTERSARAACVVHG